MGKDREENYWDIQDSFRGEWKMNVCWITFDDVREKNVRVISIKNRIEYFPKEWDVTIISPDIIEDEDLKLFITKNIVIGDRIYAANFKSPATPFRLISILNKIGKEVKDSDIIITDSIYAPFYKYFTKKKPPLVMLVHGIVSDEALSKNLVKKNSLTYKFLRIMEKKAYVLCNKLIAVTDGIKEYLINDFHLNPYKIAVIPNAVDSDLFKPMDKSRCIRDLKLNELNCYVCFVGNLAPWQGVEYLIHAAPLILKESPSTKFLIVGDGIMKEELINLAAEVGVSDNVIFIGAVPYEEVPKYINASDVCVASFIKERRGSPLKIYEYASCAKPIVSSRIQNLEFMEDQNAGILVEPEKPEELAKAIIKLLKDEILRDEMGRTGREYVVKNRNWKNIAKRIEEVCKDMTK
jgi:glycosyltransferase involved in cell wall biosynthesis